jgi:hypothetical protein
MQNMKIMQSLAEKSKLNNEDTTLSPELLHKMDACWRICRVLNLTIEKEHCYEKAPKRVNF